MVRAVRDRLRLFGFVILLPMLMAAIGGWEAYRDAGLGAAYEAYAVQIGERAQATGADSAGRQDGDQAEALAARLHHDALVCRIRMGFAWTAIAGGIASLLAGLYGILLARWGAARALASRDALLSAFSRVARDLPVILGVAASGFCVGACGIVLFELGAIWFRAGIALRDLRLLLLGLVLAGVMLWVAARTLLDLRQALTGLAPRPYRVLAREASRDAAPGLWSLVSAIAAKIKAELPDHIVIGLTQGFFVVSCDVTPVPAGDVLRGRILHLAAGPLAVFDREEITAVISHELAHFTGKDTVYSQRFLPIYNGMTRSLDAVATCLRPLRNGGLPLRAAMILGQHMLDRFHAAVRHWGRLREFEADRAMLGAVEPAAAASALLRSSAVAPLVDHVLASGAARPAAAARDMIAEIVRHAEAGPLPDPAQFLAARQVHPFDSHPPASQRIAALGIEVDDGLLARAARPAGAAETDFAGSLFADWDGLRGLLSADALAVARGHDERERAALQAAVAAAEDTTSVHEAAPILSLLELAGMGIVGVLIGAVLLAAALLGARTLTGLAVLAIGSTLLIAGLVSCAGVFQALRNARRGPIMTLTPAGLQIRGMADIVPWSAIGDMRVSWRRTVTARFVLSANATLPAAGRWPRRLRMDRRRRMLTLSGLRPRGMKPMELLALLTRYRRARDAALSLSRRQ